MILHKVRIQSTISLNTYEIDPSKPSRTSHTCTIDYRDCCLNMILTNKHTINGLRTLKRRSALCRSMGTFKLNCTRQVQHTQHAWLNVRTYIIYAVLDCAVPYNVHSRAYCLCAFVYIYLMIC